MSAKIETVQTQTVVKTGKSRLLAAVGAAVIGGAAGNLVLYYTAGAIFPSVTAWPGASAGQVVGANVVYLLIGAVVFALVRRFSPRPARHYVIIATLGLLASLALPIGAAFGYGAPGMPAADGATAVTLSLMHLLTYAISVPLFLRLGREG